MMVSYGSIYALNSDRLKCTHFFFYHFILLVKPVEANSVFGLLIAKWVFIHQPDDIL